METKGTEEIAEYYRLFFRGNRLYERYAHTQGMPLQELFLLRLLLEAEEGMSQTDICESLSQPKQTVSRVLASLAKRGLAKSASSATDGRQKLWSLTEAGSRQAEAAAGGLEAIELACMEALPSGSLEAANRTSRRFLDEFEHRLEESHTKERES